MEQITVKLHGIYRTRAGTKVTIVAWAKEKGHFPWRGSNLVTYSDKGLVLFSAGNPLDLVAYLGSAVDSNDPLTFFRQVTGGRYPNSAEFET